METKVQSSQWRRSEEPRPKKNQIKFWLNVMVLLIAFFDCNGMVHNEFLPQGRMINKEYHLEIMRNLKSCGKVNRGFCIFKTHQLQRRCL